MSRFSFIALACVLLTGLWLAGCGGTDRKVVKTDAEKAEEHHDHPSEGPHGGHLLELAEPGKENKEEYHAEWVHDDSGKITVYILDGAAKKEVPIAAEQVVIKTDVNGKADSYELPAMDQTNSDKPTAFKFEIQSKELLGKLETVGKTVTAILYVDVNGTLYEGKFEHDEHGHKH